MNNSPRENVIRGVHTGIPSWFRASCHTATSGLHDGYGGVGFSLGRALEHEIPLDIENDEWAEQVKELDAALGKDADDVAQAWFESHYPRMMKLVPRRRRAKFLAGVVRARQER